MQESVFFNEFLKKYDVCQMAVFAGAGSNDVFEALSIYRGPREAPFDKEQLAILQMLAPHLQTAFSLRRRLLALESRVTDLETALDQLGTALVLIDIEGKPIFVNRAARSIFGHRAGLYLSTSRIAAENPTENGRLREIIARAISVRRSDSLENGGAGSSVASTFDSRFMLMAWISAIRCLKVVPLTSSSTSR
jgi:PAS domain-containing protein